MSRSRGLMIDCAVGGRAVRCLGGHTATFIFLRVPLGVHRQRVSCYLGGHKPLFLTAVAYYLFAVQIYCTIAWCFYAAFLTDLPLRSSLRWADTCERAQERTSLATQGTREGLLRWTWRAQDKKL